MSSCMALRTALIWLPAKFSSAGLWQAGQRRTSSLLGPPTSSCAELILWSCPIPPHSPWAFQESFMQAMLPLSVQHILCH